MRVGVAVGSGVAFYLALLGVIVYFALRWSRRIMEAKSDGFRRELERLGGRAAGEGERGGLYQGTETRYEVQGQTLFLKSYYVSRDYVRVNLRAPSRKLPWVVCYPEGAVDRFGKAIGLNREVQTGDKAFDDAVYVDTSEVEEKVKRLLAVPDVRKAILDLVSMGFKVQLSTRGIEVFQVVYAMSAPDASRVAEALPRIAALSGSVPSFDNETLSQEPRARMMVAVAIIATVVLAGVAGAFVASGAVDRTLSAGHRVLAFLGIGGALWLLFTLSMVLVLRGRSYAFRMFLVASFIALFSLPFGGGAASLWLNQALDASPAEAHEATVRRLSRKGRVVRVTSWRAGHDIETTNAPMAVFRTLKVGDRVIVQTHRGAFGWPWAEPIRDKAKGDAP